jgi:2-(1,2-epoxy-1,2-dihydrophenyl)acetyl-CoA isomerase
MSEDLLMDVHEGVARIRINRPQAMNAMRSDMWPAMAELVRGIEHDRAVRCVLITGVGANFCSGGDVKEFGTTVDLSAAERAQFWMRNADRTNALFLTLERIGQPVVVSVRGTAAGGGLALVAAADLAICSENAKFLAAQIKLGAIPDSGAGYNLVRSIGLKRAKQYGLLGDAFDAPTALAIGVVNWVVPDGELEARTDALLARLARTPPVAAARTKAELNAAHTRTLADHFAQEALDVGACVSEEAYGEAVRAFLARRR